jgi:hypothetical protein
MIDPGLVHHFLGIEITHASEGLSQSHYALTILEWAYMVDSKPMSTPFKAKTKTLANDTLLEDPYSFFRLVGDLQYLTLTQSDISYSVNFFSQFMHALTIIHLKIVHCILRYVQGTIDIGLFFFIYSKRVNYLLNSPIK